MFTAMVIAALIVAGAATAVGGVRGWASGRRELGPGDTPRALGPGGGEPGVERGLAELRLGDVVQHGGADYLVEGLMLYDEDGHGWSAARLVDGADERWLLVGMERVGDAALRLVRPEPRLEIAGHPPEYLTLDGVRYKLEKRGTASVQTRGDVGRLGPLASREAPGSVERCRWWRYEGSGQRGIVVEQWGADFRVLAGATVGPGDLELMPGS
jgi:hypothetical protein